MRAGLIRRHVAGLSMVARYMPSSPPRRLDPDIRTSTASRAAHHPLRAPLRRSPPRRTSVRSSPPSASGARRLTSFVLPVATLTEGAAPAARSGRHRLHRAHHGHGAHGRRPGTSVVDAFGRVHELDKLYVADGFRVRVRRRFQPDAHDHGALAPRGPATWRRVSPRARPWRVGIEGCGLSTVSIRNDLQRTRRKAVPASGRRSRAVTFVTGLSTEQCHWGHARRA